MRPRTIMSCERDQCRHPFSALRRARTAICISATPFGAVEFRPGARRAAAGSCCASRISTRRAAGRNSRRRSTKTSPGSGSHGRRRCGGNRSILRDYREALDKLAAHGPDLSQLSRAAPRSPAWWREREARAPWPRDPDGAPLYPGAAKSLSPDAARAADRSRARPMRCGSTWRRRCALARDLELDRARRRPGGETGVVRARPEAWGDVILARKETPTSYHLSVVIDDALQGVTDVVRGQGPVLVDQRASAAAAAARSAAAGLPASPADCATRRGSKLSKSTQATGLRELRAQGATPADIRSSSACPDDSP